MKRELFNMVKSKEKLAIITDSHGSVIWDSAASPVSALYRAFYKGTFAEQDGRIIYANQAGMALAVIAPKLHIEKCFAYQMSECGLACFEKNDVFTEFEELIPLVKSSKDDSEVCPIEQYLSEHDDTKEQWSFLEEKFNNDEHADGEHRSCSVYKKLT